MAQVVRFGVSIEERLLERYDALIADKAYVNRSEAIRDLIRGALVKDHASDLAEKLTEHQHTHHHEIVSTLHVHLDAAHCLEVVVLRGVAREIKRIADELIGTKGVKHGKFVATTTGDIA
jgi:CopG family nickel-responsive transcriptional regulator